MLGLPFQLCGAGTQAAPGRVLRHRRVSSVVVVRRVGKAMAWTSAVLYPTDI